MNDISLSPGSTEILVIEDDLGQQGYLADVIAQLGYQCTCAASCEEGRAVFEEKRFSCMFVDLGLPDGNGLTVLSELSRIDPCVVPIILTGDDSAETIVETMRAGAFDYLTKPVEGPELRAAISRAVGHHGVVHERAQLTAMLLEEQAKLRSRVEEATADLRQYAAACENSNLRLRALLGLTRISTHYYTEEMLMRDVFKELSRLLPIRATVLCDVVRQKMLAMYLNGEGELDYTAADAKNASAGYDSLLAEADPQRFVTSWFEQHTGVDASGFAPFVYPQTLWSRSICTVGFFLSPDFEGDEADQEFLGMCSRFLAFEWEQANLLLHVAHHATLGNIATELARNFVQPLTAIRMAADIMHESAENAETMQGIGVVRENVERLRAQTQEFRKLSTLREGSVQTVRLEDYVSQALDILAVAIQNRNVTVTKELEGDFECVLLNGAALARTFMHLILSALRSVESGGGITVRLRHAGQDHVAFELTHDGLEAGLSGPAGRLHGPVYYVDANNAHPGVQLAERTVHSCGGKFSVESDEDGASVVRILLPRNATDPAVAKGLTW